MVLWYDNPMITFDSLTLKAWIEENREFLTGARIQKIQQPTRKDFVLSIRYGGQTKKLYININPQFHHVCFMLKENEEKRMIEIPQKPPMFCMLLRKYLENAVISKVNQPPYERILEFYIETFNELSEKIYLCLAVELMGKHSNVVLYNDDTNIILGCAHNVGAEKSREREMAGTLPYVYPPKQLKNDILTYNGEINYKTLSKDFYWFSAAFAALVQGFPIEQLRDFVSLKNISPAISKDYSEFSLFSELLQESIPQNSVNEMIDNYYSHYQAKDKFKTLKSHLYSLASTKLKKVQNSIEKMHAQIAEIENSDRYRLFGDLIMANLYSLKDFAPSITVFDYENNRDITIELDPAKTLKDNANHFYKLYNKSKTKKSKLTGLLEEAEINQKYLQEVIYSIESSSDITNLLEINSELAPETTGKGKSKNASLPEETELEGFKVYIGKNNRQNDYIVSKLAKDDDYWFHTKDCPGSHVLLKCPAPTDRLIFECAKIAKKYSSSSASSKIGVIYTKRKNLKKPPAANLGYVTYKNEKEIIVD